jgi:ATP-dependent RNA helicase DHX8/PRP22
MNRAAMTGAVLAKERRELKQQKAAEGKKGDDDENDSGSTALPSGDRRRRKQEESYGKRTDLSINEQRQSLPIFKLRDTLVKAVDENQVMIVVGDTGSGKV